MAALFESDVISDSGKTNHKLLHFRSLFESDVISDSGKTIYKINKIYP